MYQDTNDGFPQQTVERIGLIRPNTPVSPVGAICVSDCYQIDTILERVATEYVSLGYRVCGYLQTARPGSVGHSEDLYLHRIDGNQMINISQNLGKLSNGCRADSVALAKANFDLEESIDSSVDLLILNRFGRCESEGGGLRSVIAKAVFEDVPVLIPVRSKYVSEWRDFADSFAQTLEPSYDKIVRWCSDFLHTSPR
jgi:hypothetical protein